MGVGLDILVQLSLATRQIADVGYEVKSCRHGRTLVSGQMPTRRRKVDFHFRTA